MLFKRKVSAFGLSLAILFSGLFLSGCSSKPLLTEDGTYGIVYANTSGETQYQPLELPWNTNMAVMQELLLECSFVLSDLHTPKDTDQSQPGHTSTTSLRANFTKPKSMTFEVDQHPMNINVLSLQIEVDGTNVGQVIINQNIVLQGINNPNLEPAFKELTDMLNNQNSTKNLADS